MQRLLAEIEAGYDFSQFTMEGFVRWLERQRGREIFFIPWSMPPALFGVWLYDRHRDYVFYEQKTNAIHQRHIQLHELAHMLCGHHGVEVEAQQVRLLLRQAGAASDQSVLFRSSHSDPEEEEAEVLSSLIQERVLRHKRLQELTSVLSSERYVAAYIEALELT